MRSIVETYGIDIPDEVEARLQAGAEGKYEETPTGKADCFERVHTSIVMNNATAVAAVATVARDSGFTPISSVPDYAAAPKKS